MRRVLSLRSESHPFSRLQPAWYLAAAPFGLQIFSNVAQFACVAPSAGTFHSRRR